MPDTPSSSSSSQRITPVPGQSQRTAAGSTGGARASLAKAIPRRAGVSWWLGIVLSLGFAAVITPAITAEHWLLRFAPGTVTERHEAPFTVRAPMNGYGNLRVGGVVVARGELAGRDEAALADAIAASAPRGPMLYLAFFALTFVLAALFTHHMRRSSKGRLVRVQVVSLAVIAVLAFAVKLVMLSTSLAALVVPMAVLAMVPTMALDRVVGLATGVFAALVVSLLVPFDIGLALLLLVQTAAAGLVIAERPRRRWLAALTAGLVTTLCTGATYLLLVYLTSGHAPDLRDPLHSPWLAAAIGPALAALLAAPVTPIYQLLVGEITRGKLIALEDLGHPLLRQIAERAPGTWQHSLMMANMAEIAANAIGGNGRLVRVGAYFHDLGKSLQPKYFIENLEAGETSPHDLLPPEVSCDAIFAHVTQGIVTARKAGLHERIVDFMHMHHGNGVLEYFWARCREQGNPRGLTIEDFRYPGHPPQSRETALLAICDAVEAASRTLKQPDAAAIDSLVQRIVYGKLYLGQLDESGLSMADLRRISDSLRETIRHANHGRIEYPWQKAGQDASASAAPYTTTAPRLDSLDRKPARDTSRPMPRIGDSDAALAVTADVKDSAQRAVETSDAARVRAGTARNAVSVERRSAPLPIDDAWREPSFDRALEATDDGGGAAEISAGSTLPGPTPGLPAEARDAERIPFHIPVQIDPATGR
ncbi:MAG TPA: HDIG domain-containing protein, partial [Kofleriaceae bacterium]|nr:HDIG domain-containing protein [Kofleriaceae bacterium]